VTCHLMPNAPVGAVPCNVRAKFTLGCSMAKDLFIKHLLSFMMTSGLFVAILVCTRCCVPPSEDQIAIIDKKEAQGEAIVEELLANNCAGTSELTQDLRAMRQFSYDVRVDPFPGTSVNTQAVENEIRSVYKIAKEHGEQVCIVPVQVPAGMFFVYYLEWREVWREGVFELGNPDDKAEGNYRVMRDVICQVVGQSVRACPTSETEPVEIAVLNVRSEVQENGNVKNTAQLSIDPLGLGDLELTTPTRVELGESEVVRLEITPDSALTGLPQVVVDSLPTGVPTTSLNLMSSPNYVLQFSDQIQIYPVMMAELGGVNFEVVPSGLQVRAVTSESQVAWLWSITAKWAGRQSLILTISIPVRIGQAEEEASIQLKEIPITVLVEAEPTSTPVPTPTPLPPAQRIHDQLVNNSATILSALVALLGVLAGVYASIQNSRREANIKDLEGQIESAKTENELEALKEKIGHLRSARWWQFWRKS